MNIEFNWRLMNIRGDHVSYRFHINMNHHNYTKRVPVKTLFCTFTEEI